MQDWEPVPLKFEVRSSGVGSMLVAGPDRDPSCRDSPAPGLHMDDKKKNVCPICDAHYLVSHILLPGTIRAGRPLGLA